MHKGMYNTNIKIIKDSHDRQSEKIITNRQICKWGSRGTVQKENEKKQQKVKTITKKLKSRQKKYGCTRKGKRGYSL